LDFGLIQSTFCWNFIPSVGKDGKVSTVDISRQTDRQTDKQTTEGDVSISDDVVELDTNIVPSGESDIRCHDIHSQSIHPSSVLFQD